MSKVSSRLSQQVELNNYLLSDAMYLQLALEMNFEYLISQTWTTDLDQVPEVSGYELILSNQDRDRRCVIYRNPDSSALIHACIQRGDVWVGVAASNAEQRDSVMKMMRELIPDPALASEQQIPVNFWHHSQRGPVSVMRRLDAPAWDEVDMNYSASVREDLKRLVEARQPSGGKLILWSGHPGTGKTYALRSLVWEWRDWADAHYLIDPERFFGDSPGDLMQVMVGEDDRSFFPDRKKGGNQRWKLIILEDTGEMLAADAKTRVGQGLSRLLNIVDGMLGQGLKTIILITTNEELGTLHPAVMRPGRCWSHVKFDPLSTAEAREWLERHECREPYNGPNYLADLYGHVNAWSHRPKKSAPIGFI